MACVDTSSGSAGPRVDLAAESCGTHTGPRPSRRGGLQTDPGAVRLRCESDRARSDPVLKLICLFGRNRLPVLPVYLYCLISTVNSKINVTLSDRHHVCAVAQHVAKRRRNVFWIFGQTPTYKICWRTLIIIRMHLIHSVQEWRRRHSSGPRIA